MTACPACGRAARQPSSEFLAGCSGCCAREIARGPAFWASRHAGALTGEYRAALAAAGITHAQVKEAAERDVLHQGRLAWISDYDRHDKATAT